MQYRISYLKGDTIRGRWIKARNQKSHGFEPSPQLIRVIHSRRLMRAGHVEYAGQAENSLYILMGESEKMQTALETWAWNKGRY